MEPSQVATQMVQFRQRDPGHRSKEWWVLLCLDDRMERLFSPHSCLPPTPTPAPTLIAFLLVKPGVTKQILVRDEDLEESARRSTKRMADCGGGEPGNCPTTSHAGRLNAGPLQRRSKRACSTDKPRVGPRGRGLARGGADGQSGCPVVSSTGCPRRPMSRQRGGCDSAEGWRVAAGAGSGEVWRGGVLEPAAATRSCAV